MNRWTLDIKLVADSLETLRHMVRRINDAARGAKTSSDINMACGFGGGGSYGSYDVRCKAPIDEVIEATEERLAELHKLRREGVTSV